MNFLEERIIKDGIVKEGNVLKVDSFLNHQMDIALFDQIGKEFKRRFAKEKINKIVLSIIIALICVVLIATILVQFKTVEETDITAIETMREAELRTSLSEWKSKYNEASEQLEETNNRIFEYEQKANDEQETKNLVESELKQTNMILGKTNVKGSGVIVTVEDGESEVQASYLVDLVNELKYAGAEAISINGSRIINTSEIAEINNSYIIVNGAKRIASPYEVKAIGDQTYLTSILSLKDSGFIDKYTSGGLIVRLEQKREVQIPKYDGEMKFNYAYEKEEKE